MSYFSRNTPLKIGFFINPWAGIGGAVGLKGSDGEKIRDKAISRGAVPSSESRSEISLKQLLQQRENINFLTVEGDMGSHLLQKMGFHYHSIYYPQSGMTSAQDTLASVRKMITYHVDLILFAGGDGTARDVYDALNESIPVIGIPAGTKIHSGVYCLTPLLAGELLLKILTGGMMDLVRGSVMDINEDLFRQGKVQAKHYGELFTLDEPGFIQADKSGTQIDEQIEIDDIAESICEEMADDHLYIMGSGSTIAAIMNSLLLENTLLGIDVVLNHTVIGTDLSAQGLKAILDAYADLPKTLLVTVIGGQGVVFGRGNQQLSAEILKIIGKYNIQIVASKSKIRQLNGRPLVADTGDINIDNWLSGQWNIVTGYHQHILYPMH